MKKTATVFLLLTLVLALSIFNACSNQNSDKNSENNNQSNESTADADNGNDEPSEEVSGETGNEEASDTEKIKIGIVQPVEHTSLNEIRDTITSHLDELGLSDKVEISYKNAQGDSSAIPTIISQFVGDDTDIIVPIATSAAQAAAAATKDIPIVFAAVSYPVEAGLVSSMDKADGNITGVCDLIPVEQVLDLARTITPDIKTFGFIYNSGEINSVSNIDRAKKYCDDNGIGYNEVIITNTSELLQAVQSMVGKVEAIFVPNDNMVASAMSVLSAEAIKAKIPVYTGADSMVADGGLATVGINYKILGNQVAEMVKRIIIDGQPISDNPVEVVNEYAKMVNLQTANAIGIEIPEELLKTFVILKQ